MKKTFIVALLLMLSWGTSNVYAELAPPNLTYSVDGVSVSLNWSTVPGAT